MKTNWPFPPSPQPLDVLLDKGIVRRVYELRFRHACGQMPTPLQLDATNAFLRLQTRSDRLFITTESENVLLLRPPLYAAAILAQTKTLRKARYLRRWARRLRDYTFTREDAVVIAYASFGIDAQAVGTDAIVTADVKLVNNFNANYVRIKDRFDRMVTNLPAPYRGLSLPEIVAPTTVLSYW